MKKMKIHLSKKEYMVFVLSMVIVILSTFSYAYFVITDETEENIAKTDCFKLTFEDENEINLEKGYPISEEEGSNLRPYEFTISNVCNSIEDYQVNIETLENSTMSIDNIRIKLDNNISNILEEEEMVTTYVNEGIKDSRKIETGRLEKNESRTYNLRIWIDEESTTEQTAEKEYISKVVIISVPKQKIRLNTNGGEITANELTREIGKKLGEIEEPDRVGYKFEGWYSDSELTQEVTENIIVTNSLTDLYAKWNANTNTGYKVLHYQMDTSGNYPDEAYEIEELVGTTDEMITPEVKEYTGFIQPSAEVTFINGDGTTEVKYYYERRQYTQTTQGRYMDTSGNYGSYSTLETKDVYYGATYSYSKAQTTEYNSVSVSSYTVTGTKTNSVNITRKQYTQTTQGRYMNTSGNYGSYSTIETKDVYYGATYSYSKAATAEYASASVSSYTVTKANTNYVSFARNRYTITYNANGGSVSPTSVTGYYNTTTNLPTPTTTIANTVFDGWYSSTSGGTKYSSPHTITGAKTMYAQWATPTYTVSLNGNSACLNNNYNKQVCVPRDYYASIIGNTTYSEANMNTVLNSLKTKVTNAFGYAPTGCMWEQRSGGYRGICSYGENNTYIEFYSNGYANTWVGSKNCHVDPASKVGGSAYCN